MKNLALVLIFMGIILMACSYGIGVERGKQAAKPNVIITSSDQLLNSALSYHGIDECIYSRVDGVFYFYQGMRKIENPDRLKWCPVFGTGFRDWYVINEEEK